MGVWKNQYTGVYNTSHPEADQAESGPVTCQGISPQVDQSRLLATWLAVPLSIKSADKRKKCSDAEAE